MLAVRAPSTGSGGPAPVVGDVPYLVHEEDAVRFWAQSAAKASKLSIPPGLPQHLDSPLAWNAEDMIPRQSEWIVQLTPSEVMAVEAAVDTFKNSDCRLGDINSEAFPLPDELVKRLRGVSDDCYNGRGFCVVRGMHSVRSEEENAILFAGVSHYIAPERGFQDHERKHVLCHMVTKAPSKINSFVTPAFKRDPMPFHTDDGEILALYPVQAAKEGGRTLIASSWQVYNEMARTRPDLLHVLQGDWILDNYATASEGVPVSTPLLHQFSPTQLSIQFSRYPFSNCRGRATNAYHHLLTPTQIEALDALHFLSAKNALPLPSESGDLVYINNLSNFHGRERYKDGLVDANRHVLKMFLKDPERSWGKPASLARVMERVYGPNCEDGTRKEMWCLKKQDNVMISFAKNA